MFHKPRSFSNNVSRFLLTKFLALFRKFPSNCIFISFLFLTIWNGLSDIRARAREEKNDNLMKKKVNKQNGVVKKGLQT